MRRVFFVVIVFLFGSSIRVVGFGLEDVAVFVFSVGES